MDGEPVAACQVQVTWTWQVLVLLNGECRYLPILLYSSIWGRYCSRVILPSWWWFFIVVVTPWWGDWRWFLKSIWLQSHLRKGWMWLCGFGVTIVLRYEACVCNPWVQEIWQICWILKLLLLLDRTCLCIFPIIHDRLVRFRNCISLWFLGGILDGWTRMYLWYGMSVPR